MVGMAATMTPQKIGKVQFARMRHEKDEKRVVVRVKGADPSEGKRDAVTDGAVLKGYCVEMQFHRVGITYKNKKLDPC